MIQLERMMRTTSASSFTKESVNGAPITCLSLPTPNLCIYGQGPFLHRAWIGNKQQQEEQERLLVFPHHQHSFTLHGIRYANNNKAKDEATTGNLAVVFGGRGLALVQHVLQQHVPMKLISFEIDDDDDDDVWMLSDCILDCRFLSSSTSAGAGAAECRNSWEKDISLILAVGLAHNDVQIWEIVIDREGQQDLSTTNHDNRARQRRLLHQVKGHNHGIIYAMHLSESETETKVAVGSATQEILIWSLDYNNDVCIMNQKRKQEKGATQSTTSAPRQGSKPYRLRGHEGVIHSVSFNKTSDRLVSTSDDRTVRLWKYNNGNDEWRLEWTAWGHAARCWDATFGCSSINNNNDEAVVLSTGEDGTARLWQSDTGAPIAVLSGHACLSIWRVAACTSSSRAVTGANDGTIAIYDLSDFCHSNETATMTIMVPEDSDYLKSQVHVELVQKTINRKKSKRIKNQVSQHVIVGMEFYNTPALAPCMDGGDTCCLLVATRSGALLRFNLGQHQWTELEPWCVSSMQQEEEETGNGYNNCIRPTDGCCMAVHPNGTIVAIGTTRGNVVLAPLKKLTLEPSPERNGDKDVSVISQRTILHSRDHKTVQKLSWANESQLLSHHVQSLLWWTFSLSSVSTGSFSSSSLRQVPVLDTYQCRKLKTETSGMPICFALNESNDLAVVGDTRGSLALFDLRQMDCGQGYLHPSSVLHRVHGKEHVTGVAWTSSTRVLSVGNNGCVDEYAVLDDDDGCRLQPLLSVSLSPFSGIDRIWSFPNADGGSPVTVVGGYCGNVFAVKDVDTGYEFFRIDTGGRQRAYGLDICHINNNDNNSKSLSSTVRFAVAVNLTDGRHEINLTCRSVYGLQGRKPSDATTPASDNPPYRLGVGLHSETIFDACLFRVGDNDLALLTGSEDCSSRISLARGGSLTTSKLLPLQESGARAVCTSRQRCGTPTLAVVGGAKLMLQFFIVNDNSRDPSESLCVKFLGYGRPPEKATIDHRINTLAAMPAVDDESQENGDVHLVVAGDSNGSCYLYRVCESQKKSNVTGQLLYRADRPILSLALTQLDSRVLLLVGTTAGDLKVIDVPTDETGIGQHECVPCVLLDCKPHQMGTNSIGARVIETESDDEKTIRICTGGDDQAIFCCDVQFSTTTTPAASLGTATAKIVRSAVAKNAALSAIRGIFWSDDHHLVATGYDQQLKMWQLDFPSLRCIVTELVDVGDINCISLGYRSGESERTVAVGGAGIELFSFKV